VSRAQRPSTVVSRGPQAFAGGGRSRRSAARRPPRGAQDPGRILFSSDLAAFRAHESLYTIGIAGRGLRRVTTKVDKHAHRRVVAGRQADRLLPERRLLRRGPPAAASHVSWDGSAATRTSRGRPTARGSPSSRSAATRWSSSAIGRTLDVRRFTTPDATLGRPAGVVAGRQAGSRTSGFRIAAPGDLRAVDLETGRVSVLLPYAFGSSPAWSPDGRTIAYSYAFNILLADVVRHKRRTLAPGDTPALVAERREDRRHPGAAPTST